MFFPCTFFIPVLFYVFLSLGVFLPGLLEPSQCRGKDGTLNKPLCLAWSSMGRNHYIALVGVKGKIVTMRYTFSYLP